MNLPATVSQRDLFGASMRGEAERRIHDAEAALGDFAEPAAVEEDSAAQVNRPVQLT